MHIISLAMLLFIKLFWYKERVESLGIVYLFWYRERVVSLGTVYLL